MLQNDYAIQENKHSYHMFYNLLQRNSKHHFFLFLEKITWPKK